MSLNPGTDAETSNVWGFTVIRALLWRFMWQLRRCMPLLCAMCMIHFMHKTNV